MPSSHIFFFLQLAKRTPEARWRVDLDQCPLPFSVLKSIGRTRKQGKTQIWSPPCHAASSTNFISLIVSAAEEAIMDAKTDANIKTG
jgi:hypothetical protein